jgi:uncharacterized protein YjiK
MFLFKKGFAGSLLFFILLTVFIIVNTSCQMFWSPKSPRGYVLPKPKKIILDKKLNEISGLFFMKKENAMLAIADNKQKIYRITPDGKESHYFDDDFAPQDDFEDVVQVGSTVYVLISNGTIVELNRTDSGLNVKKYPFWSQEKNDFETLYYDPTVNSLVVLCKFCKEGEDKTSPNAYRFHLDSKQFDTTPYYTISSKTVMDILKDGKADFKPSGAAIHPGDNQLYILSSAGHLLVVANLKGAIQAVYRLNPTLYPQAEGIAFAPNGDMYISNEAKLGKATLLHIPYKTHRKK